MCMCELDPTVALWLCRLCSWLPGWELGIADVMLRYATVNVTKVGHSCAWLYASIISFSFPDFFKKKLYLTHTKRFFFFLTEEGRIYILKNGKSTKEEKILRHLLHNEQVYM